MLICDSCTRPRARSPSLQFRTANATIVASCEGVWKKKRGKEGGRAEHAEGGRGEHGACWFCAHPKAWGICKEVWQTIWVRRMGGVINLEEERRNSTDLTSKRPSLAVPPTLNEEAFVSLPKDSVAHLAKVFHLSIVQIEVTSRNLN